MSEKYNYSEKINAYLEGKLSGREMQEFEQQLRKDPIMENEFQLQKDIVNSLKEFRKAELKARLDNINIGAGVGSGFSGMNLAITVALTSLIAVGVFFYVNQDDSKTINEINKVALSVEDPAEEKINKENSPNKENSQLLSADEKAPIVAKEAEDHFEKKDKVENSISTTVDEPKKEDLAITAKETTPEINHPDVIEEFKDDNIISSREPLIIPDNDLSDINTEKPAPLEVESKDDEKHHFHYQYYNSKLYLYGNFKNIPYELIELNNKAGKHLYMHYKNNFYYIQNNEMQITPLKKIKDSSLIDELSKLRVKE